MRALPSIEISLDKVTNGLVLRIDERQLNSLFDALESAEASNEARYQLVEGCFYDYELSNSEYRLDSVGENIIQPRIRGPHSGTIAPNIYTGTLAIPIVHQASGQRFEPVLLEVKSAKIGYRDDYRNMMEFIAERCTDLLMRSNSPVSQPFEVDHETDGQTLYQRFAFIKSIINTEEFVAAVHRVVTNPVTRWTEESDYRDIRNTRRFANSTIKEVLKGGNRTRLPDAHPLNRLGISTLPQRITSTRKSDSVDTPENRFVKHALQEFQKLCEDINKRALELRYEPLIRESAQLVNILEGQLQHTVFSHISRPTTLKLNSPVLQRKEGYRDVLRVWLMLYLAAKLVWSGGDDVYAAGKKDIATLYEYWLFFVLLDLLEGIFIIDPKELFNLIEDTDDKLSLQLRQGKFTAIEGISDMGSRKLNIRFNYNRTFSGGNKYPHSGSWTTSLRPDYTLSIWPYGITEGTAESEELIVHIHFDAKYKISKFIQILESAGDQLLDDEKVENRKGNYKNADLLKMHAYKDAIRRTGGAYVLYPGSPSNESIKSGFHEIIPGLGAFSMRPSHAESDKESLATFIREILNHFVNRASQRELMALSSFHTYKSEPKLSDRVEETLPEAYGINRDLLPTNTNVLIGYYRSQKQYDWINEAGKYNIRMETFTGDYLNSEILSAKYILLYTNSDEFSSEIWRIKNTAPKVMSKDEMIRCNYPNPTRESYLVFEIIPVEKDFPISTWEFKKLKNFRDGGYPFTASIAELLKCKITE